MHSPDPESNLHPTLLHTYITDCRFSGHGHRATVHPVLCSVCYISYMLQSSDKLRQKVRQYSGQTQFRFILRHCVTAAKKSDCSQSILNVFSLLQCSSSISQQMTLRALFTFDKGKKYQTFRLRPPVFLKKAIVYSKKNHY